MPRRRVNWKFLVLLMVVVGGSAAGVWFAQNILIKGHPDRWISSGNQAVRDGKYDLALSNYQNAANLAPKDPSIPMMQANVFRMMSGLDPEKLGMERQAYDHALEIDPRYMPAINSLLDFYEQLLQNSASAALFTQMITLAERGHEIDPKDKRLAAFPDMLLAQKWMSGLSTDRNDGITAVTNLRKLMVTDPETAALPLTIAQVKIRQAQELQRQASSAEQLQSVTDLYQECRNLFTKALDDKGGAQGKNASMHMAYAKVLAFMAAQDHSKKDNGKSDIEEAWSQATIARQLVKPDDKDYSDINYFAARLAETRGDHDTAIKIYREMPDSIDTRMSLAEALGERTGTRAEGEQLLVDELGLLGDTTNQLVGLRLVVQRELTDLRVTDYAVTTDSAKKQKLRDQIQADLGKIDAAMGSRTVLEVSRVQIRFLYYSGNYAGTINAVNNLIAADPSANKDFVTLNLLGLSYEKLGQSGKAEETYQKLVKTFPSNLQAHKLLARTLVMAAPDRAPAEIETIARMSPNDPDLDLLRVGLLVADPQNPTPQERSAFAALSEATPADIIRKGRAALSIHDLDEGVRLFAKCIQQYPGRIDAYVYLSRVLAYQGKKDEAIAVANKGLQVDGNNQSLRLVISAINSGTAAQQQQNTQQIISENKDPVQKFLGLAAVAQQNGDFAEEETDLKSAETAADDAAKPGIWDKLFNYYIAHGRATDAAAYVPKLSKANFDPAGGRTYQLKLAQAQGNNARALELAKSMLVDRSEFAATYDDYGDVLLAEGLVDQASNEYKVALDKQANNLQAYLGMVRCAYAQNKLDEALQDIRQGLKKLPGDPQLRDMLITHEMTYGDPKTAIDVLRAALREDPNSQTLNAALLSVYLRLAERAVNTNDQENVGQYLQGAADVANVGITHWPNNQDFFLGLVKVFKLTNQPDRAVATLQAMAANPFWKDLPFPYAKLADFYEENKQPDLAEQAMQKAMEIGKDRLDTEVDYAQLLAVHKKFDQCLELLHSVNADKEVVRETRVRVLVTAKRWDQAAAEVQSDLAGSPPDAASIHSVWARMLMDDQKYPEAIKEADASLAIDPFNRESYLTRGISRLRIQPPDPKSASADLEKYVQMNPSDARSRRELAEALIDLNQRDMAISQLNAAINIDSTEKTARLLLVRLYSESGNYNEALRLLRQVDTRDPFNTDPEVFRAEAVLFRQFNDMKDALAASEKSLTLPGADDLVLRTNLDILLATKQFQPVVDRTQNIPAGYVNPWWAYCDRAEAEAAMSSPSVAADDAKAVSLAVASKDANNIFDASQSAMRSIGIDGAIAILIPLQESDLTCRLALATLYHQKGNDQLAIDAINKSIAGADALTRDQKIELYSTSAQIYQTAKPTPQIDKAHDAYQQWLKLDPSNPTALNNMAWLLVHDYSPPRLPEAMQNIQLAMDLQIGRGSIDVSIEDTHGWLMILSGQVSKGVNELNDVINIRPAAETYLHLADGYLRMNLPGPAADQAKAGLDFYAKQDPAQQDQSVKTGLENISAKAAAVLKRRRPTTGKS